MDSTLMETMRRVIAEEGIPVTTQIEMAVRAWRHDPVRLDLMFSEL
jgi:hypothetical protein